VADKHLYLFCERYEGSIDQIAEEGEVVKDAAVALLKVVFA
jgi:hypothetical protein